MSASALVSLQSPVVFGIDGTTERRRGAEIAAASIYRDPVRSSHSHLVKVNDLRWLCLLLLAPIPWAMGVCVLPVLTVLAPSERYNLRDRHRHKTVLDWARQRVLCVDRWCPDRQLVVVGDAEYAALEFRAGVRAVATVVTRLRMDARLFEPVPARRPRQTGRPRLVGKRLPTLRERLVDPATIWTPLVASRWYGERDRPVEILSDTAVWYHTGLPPVPIRCVIIRDPADVFRTEALLCTDLAATPTQILAWFVLRWQVEVTFHEVRAHLGVGTQRHWSDRAIARTVPALMGLFSLVTLLSHPHMCQAPACVRPTAWYAKPTPTFIDALTVVRRSLWAYTTLQTSPADADLVKMPRPLAGRLTELLSYAP